LEWQEIFGYLGATFINISFIPQVWRLYRLKSAREISLPFVILITMGGLFWLTYGLILSLPAVIIGNIVALVLNALLIIAKLAYGRR